MLWIWIFVSAFLFVAILAARDWWRYKHISLESFSKSNEGMLGCLLDILVVVMGVLVGLWLLGAFF